MSWQDRDYSQYLDDGPTVFSSRPLRRNRAALALLIFHAACAVALISLLIAGTRLSEDFLAVSAAAPHWWTILTHPIASTDFFRVLLTLLILWTIAPRIEEMFGRSRLLQSYILGNLAAGAVFFGVARLRPAWTAQPLDYPVGAGIAWLVLFWQAARHEITMIAGRQMRMGNVIAVVGGVLLLLTLAIGGTGSIGWMLAATVGGAVGIWQPLQLNIRMPRKRQPATSRPRTPARLHVVNTTDEPAEDDAEIDEILKKISRDGITSLSESDRAKLEAARQSKLQKQKKP